MQPSPGGCPAGSGKWAATVRSQMFAKSVLVLGEVTGNITATDKVTIGENGSVDGDITAPPRTYQRPETACAA